MPSSYLRRIEALEAVMGDGVCPPEGCGRCQVLVRLSRMRGEPPRPCVGRPGTIYDGLQQFTSAERQALRDAIEAERARRRQTQAASIGTRIPPAP